MQQISAIDFNTNGGGGTQGRFFRKHEHDIWLMWVLGVLRNCVNIAFSSRILGVASFPKEINKSWLISKAEHPIQQFQAGLPTNADGQKNPPWHSCHWLPGLYVSSFISSTYSWQPYDKSSIAGVMVIYPASGHTTRVFHYPSVYFISDMATCFL